MPAVSKLSPPVWQRLVEHGSAGAVIGLLTVAGVTWRETTVEERPGGEAFAYAWRAAIVLGIVVAIVSAGWEWASSGTAADIDDRPRDAPGDDERMTSAERAQAIAYCGFREPTLIRYLPVHSFIVLALSLVGLGVFGVVFGDGSGQRGSALLMLVVGLACSWGLWRHFRLPAAPLNDEDLAREVRRRKQLRGDL
jgi:hypothetical protein